MKFSTQYILALAVATMAPSVTAFAPSPGPSSMISATTALSMSSDASSTTPRTPNPVIKVAAQGMGLLKPLFRLEAQLQAAVLGTVTGLDREEVAQDVATTIAQNKVLIYTYALSPFSTEAVALLDASGYDYTRVELGAEWFALGGKGSETRVLLSQEVENGATSLPKIFIGGRCVGGCAELAQLVESNELEAVMKAAGVTKKGAAAAEKKPSLFGGLF